jgi:hypothetical protein
MKSRLAVALLAACIISGEASADIFDVSSTSQTPDGRTLTVSGTMDMDASGIISLEIVVSVDPSARTFNFMGAILTDIGFGRSEFRSPPILQGPTGDGGYQFSQAFSSNIPAPYGNQLSLSFASLQGGAITGGDFVWANQVCLAQPDFACGPILFTDYPITGGSITPEVVVTPLPAALPLFATGLGVLGLLGWRRKRKAQVAASIALTKPRTA